MYGVLFVACSLFVGCCLMFVVYLALDVGRWLPLLLLVVCSLSFVVCGLLFVVVRLLLLVCVMVCCVLFVLIVVWRLMSRVDCSLLLVGCYALLVVVKCSLRSACCLVFFFDWRMFLLFL